MALSQKVPRLIENDEAAKRCVQASFRMVMEALTGTDPGAAAADEMTGYAPGRGTWQFRMLISLARAGLEVCDVEALNVDLFLEDPEAAIREQVRDEEVAEAYIADTNLPSEVAALRECVEDPRVGFLDQTPTLADAARAIGAKTLLLCHVNGRTLAEEPGHTGHLIVVEAIDEDGVLLHNPGPPAQSAKRVEAALFEKAWDAVPNYISVTGS
jgi:hypothetical protein